MRDILCFLAVAAAFAACGDFVPKNELDPWLKGLYGKLDYTSYTLVDRSARTLEANTAGHRIVEPELPWHPYRAAKPCDGSFDGVWNWDTCFAAMGFARWSKFYAQEQFRALLLLQREDGFIGDVLRIDRYKWPYPPGTRRFPHTIATDWGKPPVAAWALWLVNRRQPDKAFLKEMYPKFVKSAEAWNACRGGTRDGLLHYDCDGTNTAIRARAAGWESGMDNSPRWDGGAYNFHAVDLNCYMVLTYRALRDLAGELGFKDDQARWAREAAALSERIETRLWDEKTQCYQDWNFKDKKFSDVLTPASYLPLFAGIASKEHAAGMARQAKRLEPMWPSVSYDHPTFDPKGYWRGRTWLNIAYFALRGLKDYGYDEIADRGRKAILDMVAADPSSNAESYDPILRRPRGCPRFSWSSTFVMDMVLDWNTPAAELIPQP